MTNHEPVQVQTYLDLNANGIVDAADPLFDSFIVAESGVMRFGSVTNVNVPFDTDPSTNIVATSWTSTLPFENVVGRRIYQVYSPTFSATAIRNITNAALGQSITGTVFAAGVPLPNAIIVALTQPNNNFAGGVVADHNGNFSLSLSAGSYALWAQRRVTIRISP